MSSDWDDCDLYNLSDKILNLLHHIFEGQYIDKYVSDDSVDRRETLL